MSELNASPSFNLSAAAMVADAASSPARPTSNRALSAEATAAAANAPAPAFSPIVLAGMVRIYEFCLVIVVGFALYAAYVMPTYGFESTLR